jgi:rhodanese-related sulfurtransferase/DNA-binding MarR family transcriptional regulator
VPANEQLRGSGLDGREVKDRLYAEFAQTAKAVGSPRRVEILELLAQREHTVEELSTATGLGITNTSAHLQVLRRAGLVDSRREGTRIHYRLAGDDVAAFVDALRKLARARVAGIDRVVRDYFESRDHLEPVTSDDLMERIKGGSVMVLDVRPTDEYIAGHIPGALSVPLDQLDAALAGIPKRAEIVAYCRGPYCVLAPQAVERLRSHGYRARRLDQGMPEWRLAGLPVAVGAGPSTKRRATSRLQSPPSRGRI